MSAPTSESSDTALSGFLFTDLALLRRLLPVTDTTSHEVLERRADNAEAMVDFRRRVGRKSTTTTTQRIAALRLCVSPANFLIAGDEGRILLPTDAWLVAVDLAALKIFASRERHRGLNAEAVLDEMALTYFAGGRTYGAVTLKVVKDRLSGGLPPLLCRVKADYNSLPPAVQALLAPLGFSVTPSPGDIRAFSRGETQHLVVPAVDGRYALEAMASISPFFSGYVYGHVTLLADNTVSVFYHCQRAGKSSSSHGAGTGAGEGEGESEGEPEREGEGEPEREGEGGLGSDCEGEGEGDGEARAAMDEEADVLPGWQGSTSSAAYAAALEAARAKRGGTVRGEGEGGGGGGAALQPLTSAIIAAAASGLRTSALRQPGPVFKTDCTAAFNVWMPPCTVGNSAVWLLELSGKHNHPLDECTRVHAAVEQEVLRSLSAKGSFGHKHAVVRSWVGDLINSRGHDFSRFIDSGFTELHLTSVPSLDGTAIAGSPGGGRGRGARQAMVPAVPLPSSSAAGGGAREERMGEGDE